MPHATLGRLGLRGFVPRSLGARPAVALERALGQPFVDAVDDAFEVLADVDPGAMWVLRRLDVRVAVPAGEPDPAVQSRRVAMGLARGVADAVAAGPGADAVRFASRAEYVGAYIRSRVAGSGGSWVFERFAELSPLAPLDALPGAARIADVDLIDVIAELAARDGWTRILASAAPLEIENLAASIERRLAGLPAPGELLAVVSAARTHRLAQAAARTPARVSSGARARLELIGELAAARPVELGLIAAIWRLEPSLREQDAAPAPVADAPRAAGIRETADPDRRWAATPEVARSPEGPRVFAATGAPAFLLLPDLAELLADEPVLSGGTAAAAAVRAVVLAGVFGDRVEVDDPAVAVAAGMEHAPEPDDWDAILRGPVTACARRLAADERLGWRHPLDEDWVSTTMTRGAPLGALSIALLRRFARHLPGFAEARASHVIPQVMPLGGIVRLDDGLVEAVLPAGPLQVLLALAGLDSFACRVPWVSARIVVGHEVAR
jgi:hypothetical protein